jgi:CheY-like chemotaxis protein
MAAVAFGAVTVAGVSLVAASDRADDNRTERAITGSALERASETALSHLGGGRSTHAVGCRPTNLWTRFENGCILAAMPELRRVTVVNDNPEFLELMQDLLQDASYPATLVDGDRNNAMELIEASEPEMLIIDLRLGSDELKGLDILRQVREHPELKHVPMVVCTADKFALDGLGDEIRSLQHVTTLSKPFSIGQLYAKLDELRQPA